MAERPVFFPCPQGDDLVKERSFSFVWNRGMAPSQKKKNVVALHAAAAREGVSPLLEVSTKSAEPLGQRLSAFKLQVPFEGSLLPLESAFQGSKVFELGGPFTDLYAAEVRQAKRDPRLRDSGKLIAFRFGRIRFPVRPRTAFYDWLYLQAVSRELQSFDELSAFVGFTDIEFNPKRSINCQARSCAALVALAARGLVAECLDAPGRFIQLLSNATLVPEQPPLFRR